MPGLVFLPKYGFGWRILAIFLFLTIFTLPLHFHARTLAPQITKECSCLLGAKNHIGLATEPAIGIPLFAYQILRIHLQHGLGSLATRPSSIRAPPVF